MGNSWVFLREIGLVAAGEGGLRPGGLDVDLYMSSSREMMQDGSGPLSLQVPRSTNRPPVSSQTVLFLCITFHLLALEDVLARGHLVSGLWVGRKEAEYIGICCLDVGVCCWKGWCERPSAVLTCCKLSCKNIMEAGVRAP